MDTSSYLSTSTADTNEREVGKLSLDKEIRFYMMNLKRKVVNFQKQQNVKTSQMKLNL